MNKLHIPAMLQEVMLYLDVKPNHWYLDATFGRGGHTASILEASGNVLAIDCDTQAIEYGTHFFNQAIQQKKLILTKANFVQTAKIWKAHCLPRLSGALFDFGASTDQLLSDARGFSFQNDAPLDMRMDLDLGVTAADLLNVLSAKQLANLFYQAGGENQAKKIALAIKSAKTIPNTTKQLADLVSKVKGTQRGKLHPATKVFQSLRIAVNTELENIKQALPTVFEILTVGGNLVTLSFHEGEDGLVKNFFKTLEKNNQLKILTPKPITPQESEVNINHKARSTKLRAGEKT